jgi:hypothetical protein
MRVEADLAEFVAQGVATVVATRDESLRPQIARGWGPRPSADGTELTLCVETPPGSRTRENLERNGAIAVTFSLPSTYRTVQIKGERLAVRDPTAEERVAIDDHVEAFSRESAQVGLPEGMGRRLLSPVLLAVTFAVRELYDQTPGPSAGRKL